jgi:hypothetical protein
MAHLITAYESSTGHFRGVLARYGIPEKWMWELPDSTV